MRTARPLALLAAVCVIAQAVTGVPELALYFTPLFLMAALLLSGVFVAEERIVRGWRRPVPVAKLRSAPRLAVPRALALTSLLERSALRRRGPPAGVPLAA